MGMALLTARRSKDPKTQVGCAIVNDGGVIVSVGYNGMPLGCSDTELPWAKTAESELDTKFAYVVHAEANSVLNAGDAELDGTTMYTTLFPCQQCTKVLIQAGVRHVVYLDDKSHNKPGPTAARKMLGLAGVTYVQFVPAADRMQLTIDLRAP
jgi:dCMP deaminase